MGSYSFEGIIDADKYEEAKRGKMNTTKMIISKQEKLILKETYILFQKVLSF